MVEYYCNLMREFLITSVARRMCQVECGAGLLPIGRECQPDCVRPTIQLKPTQQALAKLMVKYQAGFYVAAATVMTSATMVAVRLDAGLSSEVG